MEKLLTRDEFREGVLARDKHKCVFCGDPALDQDGRGHAHHILERRLFQASNELGGYFLSNGASVCDPCHMKCETTEISVDEARRACGLSKWTIPSHLYDDQDYDKWGNPILANGTRLKGELFFDESVQIVLKRGGVLDLFKPYVKYPRTHHVPWSPGVNDDDRILDALTAFDGQRVIVTEKMDGENSSLYRDYFHARSVDGRNHESRSWVKQFWSTIMGDIPEDWRVCGENLFAKHSIGYDSLPSFFMGFSIWNERNVCLSWDDTLEWFDLLGVIHVPVLYDGIYDEALIKGLWGEKDWGTSEGYVVRLASEISYGDFRKKVGKFVRRGHVQTTKHWMHGQRIEPNGMVNQ